MSTSATLQRTVQIRPSRLAALIVAVAVLTGVTTWSVSNATTHSQSRSSGSDNVSATYVNGVTALSPAEQAAIYGNVPTNPERAAAVAALSPTELAAGFGNVSPAQQYLDGVTHLSPTDLAAVFGNVPIDGTP